MSTKRLSLKQRNFCQGYVETQGNATQSALRSYNCKDKNSAGVIGSVLLNKPLIQQEIETLLEKVNMTDDFMFQRLREGTEAKVVASYQGEATETAIPDHNAAYKWWEAAAKIKRYFPAEQIESKNFNIDLQLEAMSKQELTDLLKGLLFSLKKERAEEIKEGEEEVEGEIAEAEAEEEEEEEVEEKND